MRKIKLYVNNVYWIEKDISDDNIYSIKIQVDNFFTLDTYGRGEPRKIPCEEIFFNIAPVVGEKELIPADYPWKAYFCDKRIYINDKNNLCFLPSEGKKEITSSGEGKLMKNETVIKPFVKKSFWDNLDISTTDP
jgi:hypothetical protein